MSIPCHEGIFSEIEVFVKKSVIYVIYEIKERQKIDKIRPIIKKGLS